MVLKEISHILQVSGCCCSRNASWFHAWTEGLMLQYQYCLCYISLRKVRYRYRYAFEGLPVIRYRQLKLAQNYLELFAK